MIIGRNYGIILQNGRAAPLFTLCGNNIPYLSPTNVLYVYIYTFLSYSRPLRHIIITIYDDEDAWFALLLASLGNQLNKDCV